MKYHGNQDSVLIVGAGPTGLALANALHAHRVPFAIVDRKQGPSRDSKALAVNVLTQYQLALLGCDRALGAQGGRITRLNVYWCGRRLNAVDFRRLDFPIQHFVTQPQADTELELLRNLESSGPPVRWGTELESLVVQDNGGLATLRDPLGEAHQYHYRFVVGCDGKRSLVRDVLGVRMAGHDYPVHFLLGDFRIRWELDPQQAYYFVFEDTFLIVVPIAPDRWRIVLKKDGSAESSSDPGEISATVKRLLPGYEPEISAPTWLSKAQFYMRTADSLGVGPLFIAGDAAHLFSPIGGTGMNTGIQDGLNLAWKIALVWHGHAHASQLLPTYDEERTRVIAATASTTDQSTRLICGQLRDESQLRAWLPDLRGRRRLADQLPLLHSGLGVRYDTSLLCEDATIAGRDPQVGAVCRGILELRALAQLPVPLLHPLVLAYVSHADLARHGTALQHLAQQLATKYECRPAFRTLVIDRKQSGVDVVPLVRVIGIDDRGVLKRLGAKSGRLVVVRPDAIVGYVGELPNVQGAADYLSGWLTPRKTLGTVPLRTTTPRPG